VKFTVTVVITGTATPLTMVGVRWQVRRAGFRRPCVFG